MHVMRLLLISTWAALSSILSASEVQFNRDILPILADNCFQCHGPDANKVKGGLRLDQYDLAVRATRSGAFAIVPGDTTKSALLQRIRSTDSEERMPPPPHDALTPTQIAALDEWIAKGAQYEKHWAFVKPKRPPIPTADSGPPGWNRNPIDAFVGARLRGELLIPQPEAPREQLIRRVTLDLTGLPPTVEEIDHFLADHAPDAYEKLVDRLLTSPRYGETMAVRWLDAARYADSHGFQQDSKRTMWPWRDWVIAAYNANLPFDQFSVEQIAGDLLPSPTQAQLIATGFNRNNRLNAEAGILEEEWLIENAIDRLETTGTTWLGLTLNCCRCHDHKYDPFSQKEFYQMLAFFNDLPEKGTMIDIKNAQGNADPILRLPTGAQAKQANELRMEIAALEASIAEVLRTSAPDDVTLREAIELPKSNRTRDQAQRITTFQRDHPGNGIELLDEKAGKLRNELAALTESMTSVMIMQESATPRATHILGRGQYDQPGEKVKRGTPRVLPSFPEEFPRNRLGLARWIVSPENPLTARVWVNRAWEQFFGEGLVKTIENFGVKAENPSHPELLDWLAVEFTAPTRLPAVNGVPARAWDMKALHKLLVTSATYRQSSRVTPGLIERDPENRLLARAARHRLPAEALRDQALFLGGLLVEKIGGPPVKPYMPTGIWNETSILGDLVEYHPDSGDSLYRRTIYTFWKRTAAPPVSLLFDAPSREVCTVQRSRTNTPLQSLALLNETVFVESARHFATRILASGNTPASRIEWAFRCALGRSPTPSESEVLLRGLAYRLDYFRTHPNEARQLLAVGASPVDSKWSTPELAAYAFTASVLFNLDEILTRE